MAFGEAAAVVTTLKSAYELVDKLRHTDDKEQLRAGVAQLADMVLTARASALQLLEEKAGLIDRLKGAETQIARLSDFDLAAKKYERVQTGNRKFVYRECDPPGGGAGSPFFCPSCFSGKKLSVLQGRADDSFHRCPACGFQDFLDNEDL
jgi:hypothetical protein